MSEPTILSFEETKLVIKSNTETDPNKKYLYLEVYSDREVLIPTTAWLATNFIGAENAQQHINRFNLDAKPVLITVKTTYEITEN